MAGWIKMPLGMEVDLGPGDFVLKRDPALLPKKERGPCSSVGVMGGTDRHTDTHRDGRDHYVHFASSTTHAKCDETMSSDISYYYGRPM